MLPSCPYVEVMIWKTAALPGTCPYTEVVIRKFSWFLSKGIDLFSLNPLCDQTLTPARNLEFLFCSRGSLIFEVHVTI